MHILNKLHWQRRRSLFSFKAQGVSCDGIYMPDEEDISTMIRTFLPCALGWKLALRQVLSVKCQLDALQEGQTQRARVGTSKRYAFGTPGTDMLDTS